MAAKRAEPECDFCLYMNDDESRVPQNHKQSGLQLLAFGSLMDPSEIGTAGSNNIVLYNLILFSFHFSRFIFLVLRPVFSHCL